MNTSTPRRPVGVLSLLMLLYLALGPAVRGDNVDPHAMHRKMTQSEPSAHYTVTAVDVDVPETLLQDHDGEEVLLTQLLPVGQQVVLSFIFTTCQTICPVLTSTIAGMRKQLGDSQDTVRFVSITIDPENDTPSQLRAYRDHFQPSDNWSFVTGRLTDIVTVQRAFDVYRGNKMNHEPVTFIRTEAGRWYRVSGFPGASGLSSEFVKLTGKAGP